MQPMVQLTVAWHDGIPDGENERLFYLPDFEIEDETEAVQRITDQLIAFGVAKENLLYDRRHMEPLCYYFDAVIGSFDREREVQAAMQANPEKYKDRTLFQVFTSACQVQAALEYVWEHRGRYYQPNLTSCPKFPHLHEVGGGWIGRFFRTPSTITCIITYININDFTRW